MESKMLQVIIGELQRYSLKEDEGQIAELAKLIVTAKRTFIAGAGRSGFAARGFSNRLMHLGLTVYFVGDATTPAIRAADLLIIGSGSGSTSSLVINAKTAKAVGAKLATLTIYPTATIGRLADAMIVIPGATPKNDSGTNDTAQSVQPMGTLFEQLSWLTYDAVILELMQLMSEDTDEMFTRHANLE